MLGCLAEWHGDLADARLCRVTLSSTRLLIWGGFFGTLADVRRHETFFPATTGV